MPRSRPAPPVPFRRSTRHALSNAATVVVLTGALLAGVLGVPATVLAGAVSGRPPGPGEVPARGGLPLASVLTDSEGTPIARIQDQYRRPTEPGEVAESMRAAVIAIEDRRFFTHQGVDWIGVGRALVSNVLHGGTPLQGQGASTITMQYAKNLRLYGLADTPAERDAAVADTLERKLRDVGLAIRLEQRLTKRGILNGYLDTVYFGHGAYGVAAAARTYFDTTPAALTLPQSALLAAVLRAPSIYDPVAAPATAKARRNLVLDVMAETGSITPEQAAAAKATDLGVIEPLMGFAPGCVGATADAGFFCRFVVDQLADLGLDRAELATGGYTIRTTLDPQVTAAAARAAADLVPPDATEGIANAIAVVRPDTESRPVLALAANKELGPDAGAGQTAYPLPTMPVPYGAGSIFKIFTAAVAMERGLGIRTEVPAPPIYTSQVFENGSEPYTVTGNSGTGGEISLRRALALSPNTTFVALLDELGSVDPVVDMAYRLGLRRSLAVVGPGGRTIGEAVRAEEQASFTLGPVPVIPLELANVAATIISGGVWCPPTAVLSVTAPDGSPVPLPEPACERVLDPGLADALAVALSGDSTIGTAAAAAAAAGWDRPMIGKTGTTQRHLSAGFVGATPHLAAAVMTWSDTSPPRPVCASDPPRLCTEGTLYGGTIPAATWFATMRPLHRDVPG
ncbi:MAG: penicillin-binding protein, partial [Pseudonocardia sp.]|nr:penicillin-binding protein [Pseudonocardia sp.]